MTTETCPRCRGDSWVRWRSVPDRLDPEQMVHEEGQWPCPDCSDSEVPGTVELLRMPDASA